LGGVACRLAACIADQAAAEASEDARARLRVVAPAGDAPAKDAVVAGLRQRLIDQFEAFRRRDVLEGDVGVDPRERAGGHSC